MCYGSTGIYHRVFLIEILIEPRIGPRLIDMAVASYGISSAKFENPGANINLKNSARINCLGTAVTIMHAYMSISQKNGCTLEDWIEVIMQKIKILLKHGADSTSHGSKGTILDDVRLYGLTKLYPIFGKYGYEV